MANTSYITQENDRWDLIASKAYGDSTQIRLLQSANPYLPVTQVFKAGIKIVVPILEDDGTGNIDALLPPWKRVQPSTDATQTNTGSSAGSGTSSFDDSFG